MRQLEHERGGIDRLVSNHALYRAGARPRRHAATRSCARRSPRSRPATASGGSSSSARCCSQAPAGFSAATKCFCTEHEQRVAEFVARVLGAEATLWNDVIHGPRLRPRLHDHGRHVERDAQHPRRARPRPPPRAPLMAGSANVRRDGRSGRLGRRVGRSTPDRDANRIHFVPGTAGPDDRRRRRLLAAHRRRAAHPRRRRRGDRRQHRPRPRRGRRRRPRRARRRRLRHPDLADAAPRAAARHPRRALAARRAWATCSSPAAAASRPTRRSAWPAPTTWPAGARSAGRSSAATRATTA